jgi:hypothetical protein
MGVEAMVQLIVCGVKLPLTIFIRLPISTPPFHPNMLLNLGPGGPSTVLLWVNTRTLVICPTLAYISKHRCIPISLQQIKLFSYYRAGHKVSAYTVGNLPRGLHALTMFIQANAGLPVFST